MSSITTGPRDLTDAEIDVVGGGFGSRFGVQVGTSGAGAQITSVSSSTTSSSSSSSSSESSASSTPSRGFGVSSRPRRTFGRSRFGQRRR